MNGRRAKALRRYVRSQIGFGQDVRKLAPIVEALRGTVRRRFVERAAFGRVLTVKERGRL
jgi:hypothetical protein